MAFGDRFYCIYAIPKNNKDIILKQCNIVQAWNSCKKIHQGDIATESSTENVDKEIVPGMIAIYPSCIYTSVYIKYIYVYIYLFIYIFIWLRNICKIKRLLKNIKKTST